MELKEKLVSFKVAKLAKEKGFDEISTDYRYTNEELVKDFLYISIKNSIHAPTQALLQRWLREVHNLHCFIGVRPNVKKFDSHAYNLDLTPKEYIKRRTLTVFMEEELFDTYEQALESGLEEALNSIKQ